MTLTSTPYRSNAFTGADCRNRLLKLGCLGKSIPAHRQSKQARCSTGEGPVVPCLRHNPAPGCAFGRCNLETPKPRSVDAPEARISAKKPSQPTIDRSRGRLRLPRRHRPARPSRPGEPPMGLAAWVRPHPESHFSAVLDHHYPQVVTFSLYACSRVNSRQEFRSETRKSSGESDHEDALRFARGPSRR